MHDATVSRSFDHLHVVLISAVILFASVQQAAAQKSPADGVKDLATQLTANLTRQPKKKIAVIAFQEIENQKAGIGIYLAEGMITELFRIGTSEIVERSRLGDVFDELRRNESGAFDPSTAKKVGKLVGADAVVLGSVAKFQEYTAVNCRLIDTESGAILAVAETKINKDEVLDNGRKIVKREVLAPDKPDLKEGDGKVRARSPNGDVLVVECESIRPLNGGVLVTLTLKNQSQDRHISVALKAKPGTYPIARGGSPPSTVLLIDSNDREFQEGNQAGDLIGIGVGENDLTEIEEGKSLRCAIKFRLRSVQANAFSRQEAESFRLQAEILVGNAGALNQEGFRTQSVILEIGSKDIVSGEKSSKPQGSVNATLNSKVDDFLVQCDSIRLLNGDALVTLILKNPSQDRSIFVALKARPGNYPVSRGGAPPSNCFLIDSTDREYEAGSHPGDITGIGVGDESLIEINQGTSVRATVRFRPRIVPAYGIKGRNIRSFRLQSEFLIATEAGFNQRLLRTRSAILDIVGLK